MVILSGVEHGSIVHNGVEGPRGGWHRHDLQTISAQRLPVLSLLKKWVRLLGWRAPSGSFDSARRKQRASLRSGWPVWLGSINNLRLLYLSIRSWYLAR